MKTLLLFIALISVVGISSQYQIGHYTITFQDPERGNRNIQTEIYYPATTAGTSTPAAAGEFPVIVFGHGFVMAWSAYQNLWEEFVPRGYIMVFPRTEGNAFSTDHQQFGWDLEYLVTKIQSEGLNSGSPLFNAVGANTALMGHSMGGGASFLAADSLCSNGNVNLKTLIGLAPAESSSNGVSSINSALSITVPSVIMSGSQDGVTPPADHHIPMYDNLTSDCKIFINVVGGAHCYFANTNTACDFGEGSSSSGISITRTQQHQVTFDFLNLWLDYTLKSDCNDFGVFQDSLNNSNRVTFNQSCNYQPLSVIPTINHPSCYGMNGNVQLTITGGVPAYVEDWGGFSNNTLAAGSYNYSVTDASGCSVSGLVDVVQPDSLTIVETITEPSCNGLTDGGVSLLISGGTPGYNESWGSANPNALGAGIHTYSIEDVNACSFSYSVVVTEPDAIQMNEVVTEPSCYSGANGSVVVSPTGGVSGYTVDWFGEDPANLTAGTFPIAVTDAAGCSIFNYISLGEPTEISATGLVSQVTCFGGSDGSVSLTISGGTPGYVQDWGALMPSALPAGTHSVTISDVNGCQVTQSYSIGEPSEMVVTPVVTDPNCYGSSNGSVVLNTSGGTPGYVEGWGGFNSNALFAGSYSVLVTDLAGCELNLDYTLTEPTEIQVLSNVNSPSCVGENDGSATLSITGGVPNYVEDWGVFIPNSLVAGSYDVIVTDAMGCSVNALVTITDPSQIVATNVITQPSCFGEQDGSVLLNISGGTPGYTEDWNGADPMSLGAGSYFVNITDAVGCTEVHSLTVNQPNALSISFDVTDEVNGGDGEITVLAAGGTPSYDYGINSGTFVSGNVFSGLDDGLYSMTVQDANGCTVSDTVSVLEPLFIGVDEDIFDEVNIYPVPMGNNLIVDLQSVQFEQPMIISIINILGVIVYESEVAESGLLQINVTELPSGTYILNIWKDNKVRSFKLVK